MKTLTSTKRTTRRIAASIAIVLALATSGAWASNAWIGEGVDEYYGTANNKVAGPSGRGVYFADGVIPHGSSEPLQVSSWTIRFDSYKKIAGASIYVGRACLTDSDKIWTVIADNDDCGFYLDSDYNLEVGWNSSYGDGYFRVMNGKYSVKKVYIGPNVADPETKGVLSIGSDGHASSLTAAGNVEIRNGDLITTNTAVTCGNMTAANKNNSSATIDKTGGDWTVNGDLKMNTASGTTATFYNRGGNLVVTNNFVVQNSGSGEFYMEGGYVTVSNMVRFAENWLESGNNANLYLNGGIFEAKAFRFHNGNTYAYVIFNGGTYKAMADGDIAVHEGRVGYGNLRFKVGERGGTMDTAGHDVISPFRLLQDGSSTGGICVKGGGSLTLENANVTYTGKTCIEAGTMLVVSNSTVKSNILSHGIELVGAPTVNTEYTVFRCNDDLDADTDLANVTCPVAESFTPGIGTDGKSIVVTVTALKSGNVWTGAKDNNLSDSANWLGGNVPTSGSAEIYCPVATTLTVGDTFAPATITISSSSALVTIGSGTLYVSEVVNRQLLAVGTGATVVIGDQLILAKSESLCDQNNGTLVVSNLLLKAESGDRFVTANQTTSASGVFKFNTVTNSMTDNWFYFANKNNLASAGVFYIGEGGLSFLNASKTAGYCLGRGRSGNSTTIRPWYSDFKIADSGTGNDSLILMRNVTFCTDDENGKGRTITIEARTNPQSSPVITVSGSGTLQMNGTKTGSAQPPITVTDTATLAFGANGSLGTGDITLGAGTKLVLTANGKDFTALANTLNLPTEGTATIRIDGERLKSGDNIIIATVGNDATIANVAFDGNSTALAGRKYTLRVEDGKLILKIVSDGTVIIVR